MTKSIKVENMTSPNGNKVPNQFIIRNEIWNGMYKEYFQSYDSVIACIVYGYNLS